MSPQPRKTYENCDVVHITVLIVPRQDGRLKDAYQRFASHSPDRIKPAADVTVSYP